VSGPSAAVADFVQRIALVVTRRVAGQTVRQTVPFSFESMYAMARIKDDSPGEAFDLTRWPIQRRGRSALVRYRLHTRNVEMHPLLKRLSKVTPRLAYALVTRCLDDNNFGHFAIGTGKVLGKWLGDDWSTPFYENVAQQHKRPLDEVYDDDDECVVAEGRMRDAAMKMALGTDRVYDWTSGREYRVFEDERANFMLALAQTMQHLHGEGKRPRARTKK
jgi:hypothetical protein